MIAPRLVAAGVLRCGPKVRLRVRDDAAVREVHRPKRRIDPYKVAKFRERQASAVR